MDLHRLRIFVAVAHAGNFTRAAAALYMAQPTVSQQIAALEAELGASLIERRSRRQRLTAAGAALLPYAERLLALADEATAAVRTAAGVADRTLRLGVGHMLATYLLPELLGRYRARHPQHHWRISVGNTAELLDMVAAGGVELALVGSPAAHEEVEVVPFMEDRLVVIVAPDDPWAQREAVEPAELRARPLLAREPGSALHAAVERLLGPAVLGGEQVIVLGEEEAIKRSVEVGLGVALVQAIAVRREVASGRLRALSLRGADDRRLYAWARLRHRPLSAAGQALVDLLGTVPGDASSA